MHSGKTTYKKGSTTVARLPLALRAYLAATHVVPFAAKRHLRLRIANGKEHPERWTEKLGRPSLPRPEGRLIWLHAVGLGEVLSLRGLITEMAGQTDAHFLVTSSTRAGADAFAHNAPPRTVHQFLPLDAPAYRKAFLEHWRPDLCIWVEQDIWPGFVHEIAQRGIPQTLIAARMNADSFARHQRSKATFHYVYDKMALVTAQDEPTAQHLHALGAKDVQITGSLKALAPALSCDTSDWDDLRADIGARFVWITAPAHQADIDIAMAAHTVLRKTWSDALLIIAPRFPDANLSIPLPHTRRSWGEDPTAPVWLADTFGELGLMYRLAQAALIGGTHDATEGHNPWEAVALDTAVFHGPHIANFVADYAALSDGGAVSVSDPAELAAGLRGDLGKMITRARDIRTSQAQATRNLARTLVALHG